MIENKLRDRAKKSRQQMSWPRGVDPRWGKIEMNSQKLKKNRQLRRRNHVRRLVRGTADRPRLTVFRSSKHIYAQLINDDDGLTLASASSQAATIKTEVPYGGNTKAAEIVGKALAKAALEKGISKVAFDRGHYRYHGRIKALADGARAGGLQF